mmetsp:Transcript_4239/g.8053  ORF Transcript_4239/g.8053 Transcript_4239/m.8053 type:complete len:103 (+) Transcript_4239:152-460(+)
MSLRRKGGGEEVVANGNIQFDERARRFEPHIPQRIDLPNPMPPNPPRTSPLFFPLGGAPNTFQNLSVSSAAALTTVPPSGDCAMCSTLAVCPFSSAIFVMDG